MSDLHTKKQYIEGSLYTLMQEQPFYAALLSEINISFSNLVPTAALTYEKKKDYFQIHINYDFFNKLTKLNRVAILHHEILHFSNNHLFRWMKFKEENEDHKLFNISADMAINQYIKNLPAGCPQCPPIKEAKPCPNENCIGRGIDVKDFTLSDGSPFPTLQPMETYYKLLKETSSQKHNGTEKDNKGDTKEGNGTGAKDSQGNDKGDQPFDKGQEGTNDKMLQAYGQGKGTDEHLWDDLTEDEKQRMLKEAEKVIKRTIEKTSNSYSQVPDSIKDLLNEIDTALSKLNYKDILKSAIKKTLTLVDRTGTWKRQNKRYGVFSPGTKNGETPKLNIYMDTSGSISYTELSDFLKIIDGFMGVGARKCTLGLWHTALYKTMKYKRSTQFTKNLIESGGTCVGPVLEHIKKNTPDLSIILTDGYYDNNSIKIGSSVFWIISKGGNQNHPLKHIGKTILLENIS